MSDNYRFLNPYNFVRYLPEGGDNGTPEMKLLGRCIPPPHDRFIGLTGKIECELEAKTPIFITDSEFVEDEVDGHKSYRFFRLKDEDGREVFAVPSTSLRGMIRTVFEAVTNSCFSVFEGEKRLSYHLPPNEARKLVPCRIEKKENGHWQLRLFPGTTEYSENGLSKNDCLYAAWIKMYNPLRQSQTERQNPDVPYSKRPTLSLPKGIKHGDKCFALLKRVEHPARRNRSGRSFGQFFFWNVVKVSKDRNSLGHPKNDERIEEGYICITYQNIENKHDERFFFRASKNNSLPETIDIDDDIIDKYVSLIKDYKERHKKHIEKIKKQGDDPSKVKDDRVAYSRFILEDKKDLNGELVYAMLQGTSPGLSVKFIVPVTVPRVGYEHTIGALLPSHLHPCYDYNNLCPACRVFGWVHLSPSEDLNIKVAYAGRLKISHAELIEDNGTLSEFPLAILSTPKPTTTFFYLLKDRKPDFDVTYNTPGANLRGRKFYRHQEEAKEQEYVRAGDIEDDQNRTIRDALKPGAKFKFSVEFENLAPVELGALLWTIEMDDRMFHKLGMGKPLGFGSVEISIKEIKILDIKERYVSYTKDGWRVINDKKKEEWINLFKESMEEKYGKQFDDLENIKDLKAILSVPNLPVHYPRTTEEPTPQGKNFEWFVKNKRNGRMHLELANEDTEGFPLQFSHKRNEKRRH